MKNDSPDKQETTLFVLSFLLDKPGTQNSLPEIVYSWLRQTQMRRSPDRVKGVLKTLVRRGLIVEVERASGPPSYRLNPEKLAEIRALLASPENR